MTYTIVVAYRFAAAWLAKSWEERGAYEAEHLRPIFARHADKVSVRFFDAEAFSARHSDFMIAETDDLKHYYYMIESLRESRLFKDGLAEFTDVILGIEDGFREFERDVLSA